MKTRFLSRFNKDLDSIKDTRLLEKVRKVIEETEAAFTINELKNVKKLRGDRISYRIRIGDYRIGIFYEKGVVEFARLVHRKDIYRVFP